MSSIANDIKAEARNLNELLGGKKYQVDYFQREYRWQEKHIGQLLTDLETSFLSNYNNGDNLESVSKYNCYYMGPVVICSKDTLRSIVDGQQRLTTMTLLLIHLNNLQKDNADPEDLESLIYSKRHGRKSYNIEVPDRTKILDSLFQNKSLDLEEEYDESIRNMYDRYHDIARYFPQSLKGEVLPLFIDWMKDKIIFIEIIAFTDENAYTIFETMNDRGLNLTSTEMLKSFILSNVKDEDRIIEVNELWKKQISELHKYSPLEDLEFIKAWLRSIYADTIRSSTKGAENEDFERIGTRFHNWVRDNLKRIGLKSSDSFYYFIKADFEFYVNIYRRIKDAEATETPLLEAVYLNSFISIASSLSYPLYMSSINKLDNDKTVIDKINVIARFLDVYTVTRTLQGRSTTQNAIRYFIYSLVKEIRGKDLDSLKQLLKEKLQSSEDSFSNNPSFKYSSLFYDKKFVRYLFARMTLFIERTYNHSDLNIDDLMPNRRKSRYVLTEVIPFDYYIKHQLENYYLFGNKILIPHLLWTDFQKIGDISRINLLKNTNIFASSVCQSFEQLDSESELYKIKNFNDSEISKRTESVSNLIPKIWSIDTL